MAIPPLSKELTVFSAWGKRPGDYDRNRRPGRHDEPAGVCDNLGRPPIGAGSDDDVIACPPGGRAMYAVLVMLPLS